MDSLLVFKKLSWMLRECRTWRAVAVQNLCDRHSRMGVPDEIEEYRYLKKFLNLIVKVPEYTWSGGPWHTLSILLVFNLPEP